MNRLTIEAAVAKFLANGGEIVSIPEVKAPVSLKDALNIAERVIDKHLAANPVKDDEDDINFRGVEEVRLALPENSSIKL